MGAALIPILTTAISAGASVAVAEQGKKSRERINKKNIEAQEAARFAEFRKQELAKQQERNRTRIENAVVHNNMEDVIKSRGIAPRPSSLSSAILGGLNA
jgi:hypothetical protein